MLPFGTAGKTTAKSSGDFSVRLGFRRGAGAPNSKALKRVIARVDVKRAVCCQRGIRTPRLALAGGVWVVSLSIQRVAIDFFNFSGSNRPRRAARVRQEEPGLPPRGCADRRVCVG